MQNRIPKLRPVEETHQHLHRHNKDSDVWRVRHGLRSTLKHFRQAKYHSTSRVRYVATKLSKIVGSYRNAIIRTKIVLCMDVAAYSDVRRCDSEANLEVH